MTVWSKPNTILKQRHALRTAGLIALCVALITTLLFGDISRATAGINQTLSFGGRLQTSSGNVVADGYYNIQFKIYQDGDGCMPGESTSSPCGGTLKWFESYVNNGGTSGVKVTNGYFSVNLGSKTAFGTSVDWNQDTLWLSMNIAGTDSACSNFSSCSPDGEMLPMKRITSTPFALNSGMVGGKTANQLVQLGQGVQADNSTSSSIFLNKTNTGSLIQLQNMATDVFTVANNGDLTFGNNANHSIGVAASAADVAGMQLNLTAGAGGSGSGSAGGNLVLSGGAGGGTNGDGGSISIDAGLATGSGTKGTIAIGSANAGSISVGSTSSAISQDITIGANNTSGSTSNVTIGAGSAASGGSTTIQSKDDLTIKTNGTTRATFSGGANTMYLGNGSAAAAPNDFKIQGTGSSTTAVTGGTLTIQGGDATTGDANGGNIVLSGGNGSGTGAAGLVILGTPTFSTTANDANCYASGTLVASNCTIAASSVNGTSAIMVGFSAAGQVATVPDPALTTAGRVIYVIAANGSKQFILRANTGAGAGVEQNITMNQNTTATLIWNGTDWTAAGTSSDASLFSVNSDNNADGISNVQVGSNAGGSAPTLFTLDKSNTAPIITDASLLGSMYYDTEIGKVQCYEADGWGACGSAPDAFISLSPEYANAVTNGTDTGTLTSDFCSDALDINDGTSSQPTICGTNETQNFYKWTTNQTSNQTRSIYVTYQLPSNFKNFVEGTTSLLGRTDHADSSVTYQIYRNNASGLTPCGSSIAVVSGFQSTWHPEAATDGNDPANCNFAPGDSILIRINLTTKNDHNAYVSNLNFVFSNN